MHVLTPPTCPPFDFSLVDALCIWAHANYPKARYAKLADKFPDTPYVTAAAGVMFRECAVANPVWFFNVCAIRSAEVLKLSKHIGSVGMYPVGDWASWLDTMDRSHGIFPPSPPSLGDVKGVAA